MGDNWDAGADMMEGVPASEYDFEHKALRVIEAIVIGAIAQQRGALATVVCALREAFDAGKKDRDYWHSQARLLATELEMERRRNIPLRDSRTWDS